MSITTTIPLKEIHCESCEKTIHDVLSKLPGVLTVAPDAELGQVQVRFESSVISEGDLRSALVDIGYDPLPAKWRIQEKAVRSPKVIR